MLDCLTDLAARYLSLLCQSTADHALHNHGDSADFTVADVRMALKDAGALLPEKVDTEQEWRGEEDLRGIEDFVKWFAGTRMKEMMEFGSGDGESDATDYLNGMRFAFPFFRLSLSTFSTLLSLLMLSKSALSVPTQRNGVC